MRKLFVLAAILGIVITACQKEIDWGINTDQLLMKIRSVNGPDSTIVNYGYDGQRRLVSEITFNINAGTTTSDTFVINRNSSGVITTTVMKGNSIVGIDSLVTRYFYNNTNSRYYAATRQVDIGGFMVTDSAEYSYDGAGRINLEKHWVVATGIPSFQSGEFQYTYSAAGGKLDSVKQYVLMGIPGGPLSLFVTQAFNFDAKTNPLQLKNEAVLLGRYNYYGTSNPTRFMYKDETDPAQDFNVDYWYKYNMAGKPDSSSATQNPGGTVTASKYFYQ